MTAKEIVEARDKCRTNPIYLAEVLGYDMVEQPHLELFNALGSAKKKKLVLWSRGHFKTSCVAVYIVQRILCNPDFRVVVLQSTAKLTKLFVREVQSHFNRTNPKSRLHELFGNYCARGIGNADGFTVPARTRKHLKEATVTAASPRAVTTGQHYDLIVADDLVTAVNYRNVELLDKLETDFYHLQPLLDPGGEVIVTGTRYSFADLYARILAKDITENEWEKSVRGCFKADGSLLFPQRTLPDGRKIGFTLEILADLKRAEPEVFAAQYLNAPTSSKDQLFPETLLQSITKSSHDADYPKEAPCIFTIDLATGKRADADHSVVAVGRSDISGRVWIADCIGGTLTPHALAMTIISKAVQYRPARILIEKQPGAEFFGEFLKTVAREKGVVLPVDYTSGGSKKDAKYMRIASLESAMRQKRLFLLASITDYPRLSEEFEQFPRGRHDDRPDCIALLYAALSANVPFQPVMRILPWIFDTPYSEKPHESSSPLGDGFVC